MSALEENRPLSERIKEWRLEEVHAEAETGTPGSQLVATRELQRRNKLDQSSQFQQELMKQVKTFKNEQKSGTDRTFAMKDSGERQEFSTGAKRDRQVGKGRYDLIPPHSLKRLADILEKGALKYSDRNWEKGMPLTRYVDSCMRHLLQYVEGWRDEDHLGQAFWNLMACVHTEEMIHRGLLPEELNDLPCYLAEDDPPPGS